MIPTTYMWNPLTCGIQKIHVESTYMWNLENQTLMYIAKQRQIHRYKRTSGYTEEKEEGRGNKGV